MLAMNKGAYDRLPRDLKIVIDNNSDQLAAGMAGAMWDIQAAAVANTAVERGDLIVTLLPEAVAHWRKATEPVVEAWRKEMKEQKIDSAKLLLGAHALLAKYANEPQPQLSQEPPAGQQAVTEQPRAAPGATPKFNNAPLNGGPASAAAPSGPVAKPALQPPQPLAPHVLTPATTPAAMPAATPAPAAPSPKLAKPAAAAAPLPPAASSVPAAPTAPAAPATASVAPAAKPMAATVAAPTPAPPAPAPPPAAPPSVAAPPPPPAPPLSKPVPKTFDIPL